jgi:subtilisin family serine protease
MRTKLLIALAGLLPFFAAAQNKTSQQPALLQLSTGAQMLLPATSPDAISEIKQKTAWASQYIWLARFSNPPSGTEKIQWEKDGMVVLSKLDNQTYYVSTSEVPTIEWLQKHRVTQTAAPNPQLKLDKSVKGTSVPAYARDGVGRVIVLVAIQPKLDKTVIKDWLRQNGFELELTSFEKASGILTVHVPQTQLQKLAAAPFTVYIQAIRKDRILNERVRFFSGGNAAQAPLAVGGHNLKGSGVVVGVGDLGNGDVHPDLGNRANNMGAGIVHPHGAHVSATIAGGGIVQGDLKGMAPLATLINQYLSGIWENAVQYFHDFGMVLTNNSYGNTDGDCPNDGEYDLYSNILDGLAFEIPEVLNVFASGNSGANVCNPYKSQYNTILSGYQTAKNVVTVGWSDYQKMANPNSSSGPVNDGRLKPEIMSLGVVQSANENAGYTVMFGTSMAAPGVAGGLALLYERYKQISGGQNPQGALMKNLLLNGAHDIGTPGPDYKHGYGYMNLDNSLRMLDNHYYFEGAMATGGSKDTVIAVPEGMAFFKVMLYWHDPAATPLAPQTLMNDLDLEVVRPDGTVVYPKRLNGALPNVADIATEGVDRINNSEQVVIETPLAGNYTIRVKGFDVSASSSQAYYTSFDFVPGGLRIRTPVTGDSWSVANPDGISFVPGMIISWEDIGTPMNGTYQLEYSLDAGQNWTIIPVDTLQPNVPLALKDTAHYYGWRPQANTNTNRAMVRVTKNGTSFSSTSGLFSILNRPTVLSVARPCEGYLTINWQAVPGADDYEVIMKQGNEMVPIALVTSPLTYTIKGLNKDSTYYVGVRARKEDLPGRYRSVSGYIPNTGACAGMISDGDLKLDSITSPLTGRQFTSGQLGASESIKVRIKNLDNAVVAAGSYEIKYSIDGGEYVTEPSGAIASLGTYTHTFSGANLSVAGEHIITAVVKNTVVEDNVPQNDTFRLVVKNLTNPLITPTTIPASSFVENFDNAPAGAYQANTIGLTGLDHWDYFNRTRFDRARTFVHTGIARSGNRAITLDLARQQNDTSFNRLQGNFNLSGNTLADEVRLDFQFKQHGSFQKVDPKNKVWVRGNDQAEWLEVYDLGKNQPVEAGEWKISKSIELNDVLAAAGQSFTSSTQVRFGQSAQLGMADNTHLAGYTFDDVRLYVATNDLQLLGIDEPAIYSCGLTNATPIKIVVRNSMAAPASGVQVSYSINGGPVITETITETIAGNTDFVYEFKTVANLGNYQEYTIIATVNFPGDNVPENNSTTAVVYNLPTISQFPYVEDFEQNNGHFFTSGISSSWQWGVPASKKIDTAASGIKVWKTSLAGNYNDNEFSYLNSPCFDLSNLTNPMLSFSFAYDMEDCRPTTVCDSAWMEYSIDGTNWKRLGVTGQGTNWYDHSGKNIWVQRNRTHWHVATIPLPKVSGSFRFRFVLASDIESSYEGLAIDDIHVYDLAAPMYTQKGVSNGVTQPVQGMAPIHFTDDGKLIATILPNSSNLGSTEVKAYIFDGPVRNNNGVQYYGNRNITIKPASNPVNNNVKVRFYFTDREVDSMRLAKSCSTCAPIKDYSHLGVTQYTDADKNFEDGDLANNLNGFVRYISGNNLRILPYDSGYYAEFDVAEFSEFWLNKGGGDLPLPSRWINIKASKQNSVNGRIEWSTASETDVDYFEVQFTSSKQAADAGNFETLEKVFARNNSQATYMYLDVRGAKNGEYFYRIKQVSMNGDVLLSPVRSLNFDKLNFYITLRPNPIKDNLLLAVQSPETKTLQVKIINITGQTIYLQNWSISGGHSQLSIPVQRLGLSKGIYTVGVGDGKNWWYGKVLKQ